MAAAKDKPPNAAKAQSGENKVVKAEKAPAVKKALDGGKEEPTKQKAPAPVKEKGPASVKEKASDASKAQDGEKAAAKAEKTPAEKLAQDGGKKEPEKEKTPVVVKVQDEGKKTAKVEKSTVSPKAGDEGKDPKKDKVPATAKEKSPAAVKVQNEGKKTAKEEKSTVSSKAGDEGKDPKKEKVPATAKAQDGGKKAAAVEPPTPGAEAGDGAAEPTEAAAMAVVKAQGEGKEVSKGTEGQPPTIPEPPRPALLQSLSCPAACHRYPHPPGMGGSPSLLQGALGLWVLGSGAAGCALLTSHSCFQGGAALGRDGDNRRGDHDGGVKRGSDRAWLWPTSPREPAAPGTPWHLSGEDIAQCHRAAPGSCWGGGAAWSTAIFDRGKATPQPLPHP